MADDYLVSHLAARELSLTGWQAVAARAPAADASAANRHASGGEALTAAPCGADCARTADRRRTNSAPNAAHEFVMPLAPIRNAVRSSRVLCRDSPTHAAIARVKRQVHS